MRLSIHIELCGIKIVAKLCDSNITMPLGTPDHPIMGEMTPDVPTLRVCQVPYGSIAPPSRYRNQSPRMGPSAAEASFPSSDPFLHLGTNPRFEFLNPTLLNHFLSDMGKIQGRNVTGLTRKSQRAVGKAVRRARAMGIMPTLGKAQTIVWE